ncbi:MAG: hypothetical protein AB1744_16310, partial [Candidatus Zixiibacteriota bacterium]
MLARRNLARRYLTLAAALLPLWACGDDAPPPLPDYVLDSGVDAAVAEASLEWMDNTRVLTFVRLEGDVTL